MPACRILPVLVLAGLLAGGDEAPPPPSPQEPRVIVFLGGDQEVKGYLTYESDDTVELRTLAGKVQGFAKARVVKVLRLVDPAPGQRGMVFLRDGQRREGVVLEDGFDYVLLEIDGIKAKLPRPTVDHVLLQPTFEERFAQYRDAARTPVLRLELCRWLVEQRRYDLARSELTKLLADAPGDEARQLLTVVEAQLALGGQPPADAKGGAEGPVPRGAATTGALPSRLISREDVNIIRVYEIDLNRPPKVAVDAETIRTMLERYSTSPEIPASEAERRNLYRADPKEVVELMFKLRARELYPRIEVLSEPWSLNLFRQHVHNAWLINNCATSACHGGTGAGRFFLYRRGSRDERVRYTNLLILERLELDTQWPLVNFEDPMKSLIIQYGLARDEAKRPHPDVKGWKPVFDRSNQRLLHNSVTWIESMVRPRPQYPVEYEPPRLGVPGAAPPPEAQPPLAPAPGPQKDGEPDAKPPDATPR